MGLNIEAGGHKPPPRFKLEVITQSAHSLAAVSVHLVGGSKHPSPPALISRQGKLTLPQNWRDYTELQLSKSGFQTRIIPVNPL